MNRKTVFAFCAGLMALAMPALALSPADLKREMDKRGRFTIVDVRSTDLYAQGHIPGAINIPAALCETKHLPPLGRVIVYDAGLGTDLATGAAKALSAKPGIKAEVLEGGFSSWEAVTKQTTRGKGVEREMLPMATYQQVKTNSTDDVVLVDLRKNLVPGKSMSKAELLAEFPQARVTDSPFGVKAKSATGPSPLLVLVDAGEGTAEEMARTLRANGMTRFVILAGGEEIIKRQGQPGLKRTGSTITAPSVPGN
jgi:rhodanese-related sulfurtransferase